MSTTNIPDSFYRISVKALIWNESKTRFMLIQEDNGTWELPGGGLDFEELPDQCLIREIREEMNLAVDTIAPTPELFFTWYENNRWRANVVYETTLINTDFTPSQECIAAEFFSIEEARMLKLFPNVSIFLDQLEVRLK